MISNNKNIINRLNKIDEYIQLHKKPNVYIIAQNIDNKFYIYDFTNNYIYDKREDFIKEYQIDEKDKNTYIIDLKVDNNRTIEDIEKEG